ncbi:roadblock/LC7 domain-containing protein [Actinocorallia longicatena]|uniref:Roadblock/LC7 domain-containing protein n=1 Tax=Actinocorallia longicatena TaxID=111803 RepID=A0ABP6Q648_9ACTN
MNRSSTATEIGWLLDDLVSRVDAIKKLILLSQDGLVVSASSNVARADADVLAAMSSGIFSLAHGARNHFGGDHLKQAIIEIDRMLYFVIPAGPSTCLAVLSESGPNAGGVAYETAVLVKRLQGHLGVAPRDSASTGMGPG